MYAELHISCLLWSFSSLFDDNVKQSMSWSSLAPSGCLLRWPVRGGEVVNVGFLN